MAILNYAPKLQVSSSRQLQGSDSIMTVRGLGWLNIGHNLNDRPIGRGRIDAMLIFNTYRENPSAPVIHVTNFGGMFQVAAGMIMVTVTNEIPNGAGQTETVAAAHLMWPAAAWTSAIYLSRYAQREFLHGKFDCVFHRN